MNLFGDARRLSLAVVAAVVLGASAGTAWSAGDMSFAGCIANAGVAGCVDPASDSLGGAVGPAVSPDGQDVYVAGQVGDSVTHLNRAAGGSLSFADCVANAGAHGCADPGNDSLDGAVALAVSPDGEDVYVVSLEGDSITHLARGADGALTFSNCVADAGKNGCTDPAIDSLNGAVAIAISADGDDVYVASRLANAVTHLTRAADGTLTFADCVADSVAGCSDPANAPLAAADGVAVAPDGEDVYVAASSGDSVTQLARAGDGSLTFSGCVASTGADGCVDVPSAPLDNAAGIAVSPDGADVYVAALNAYAVVHVDRAADGSLAFADCIADGGTHGCADPASDAFEGAIALAVAPDGSDVYVSAVLDNAVSQLDRGADGSLSLRRCFASVVAGCAPGHQSLTLVAGLAVAPDGDLYAAGSFNSAVAHFTFPDPPGDPDPGGPGPGGPGSAGLTPEALAALTSSEGLPGTARLRGSKLTLKVRCPVAAGGACDYVIRGLAGGRRSKPATKRAKAAIPSGERETVEIKVKSSSLAKYRRASKVTIKAKVTVDGVTATVFKRVKLRGG